RNPRPRRPRLSPFAPAGGKRMPRREGPGPGMWGRLITCAAVDYRRRPPANAGVPSGSGRLTIGCSLTSCPTRSQPVCNTAASCPSKLHPQGQLEDSGIARLRDAAERGRAEIAVGLAERRRVAHIEGLGANLGAQAFAYLKQLSGHQVRGLVSRPAHRIARCISNGELTGGGE